MTANFTSCPSALQDNNRDDAADQPRQRGVGPFVCAAATALLLSACGGGSDDAASSASAAASSDASSDASGPTAQILQEQRRTRFAPPPRVSATTIVVRASSTQTRGIGAVLQLRYNGRVIASGEITSTSPMDLTFNVNTLINGGTLDVIFTNAVFADWTPARQLTVSTVSVNGIAFSPLTTPGTVYDRGQGAEAFDGIDVVAVPRVMPLPGALRIPMPSAASLPAQQAVEATAVAAEPGPYVDMVNGSDANPGTDARPYASLGKLVGRQLLPGENVHLRCGNLWRETLALGVMELADGTQVVPYGNDCATAGRPVISGSDQFNGGWTRSGAMWSRSLPQNTPKISRLWVGNTSMHTARWPNAGTAPATVRAVYPPAPRYFWMDDGDAATLSTQDFSGATVLLNSQPWSIDARPVAAGSGAATNVILASDPTYQIGAGDSWFATDKRWMLDAPGEFFHDVAAQRLYFIPAAADASLDINAVNVEGSVRDAGIALANRSNLVLRGVTVWNTRQDGIRVTDAPQALLSDVESRTNGQAGIRLMQWQPLPASTPGPRVENSLVAANGEYGIDATYVRNASIQGNRALETGVGFYTGPVVAGIAAGPGGTVTDNVVDWAGYAGIVFSSQGGSTVARNEISNYCQRLTDCGAIYSWTARADISPQQASLIESNRILATNWNLSGRWSKHVIAGIYLDDNTQRAVVRNNFAQGMPIGIFLHNASLSTVENNQIWLARESALNVSMDRTDADWSTGNVLRGNKILPMMTASSTWPELPTFTFAPAVSFTHVLAGRQALGAGRNEFANNQVLQLNGPLLQHALISDASGQSPVDIATWRQLNPSEPDVLRPATFSPYMVSLGPEKVPGGEFDGGLGSWLRHWDQTLTGFSAVPVAAQPGCNGPCMRMTSAGRGDALISPSFTLRPGVPHVYSWTGVATGAAVTLGNPYVANESTWQQIADAAGFVTLQSRDIKAGETKRFEAFFTPRAADPVKVLIQLDTLGPALHVDSVSVREVQAWWFSGPPEWVGTVVAGKTAARTVSACADFGWPADCRLIDTAGAPVALPFTVPAGSQQLVLWSNSPFRR